MKYCVIYNPFSGKGGALSRATEIAEGLGEGATVTNMTEIGDYRDFFSELTEDDVTIICGGDGTLNRFVCDTEKIDIKCDILYAAVGTGNDFLRDLNKSIDDEPFSVKEYLKDLPYVEFNGKKCRFLNGIGFGIDGYCCEIGDKLKAENPEKPVNYTAIAIKGLLGGYKPRRAKVSVDGAESEYKKVWLAATMHGRYYGGGMNCAPSQDRLSADGKNTLVVMSGYGKLKTLITFPSIFKGEHVKHKMVTVLEGHDISVTFDRPTSMQIDGETVLGVTGYSVCSSVKAHTLR